MHEALLPTGATFKVDTFSTGRARVPRASIIMRCKNSDWVIQQTLASLFSQNYTDFELLVIDSGSRDRTLEIVRNYPCTLIEIEPTAYVPGAVLNMAGERARGSVLVFLNSDTVPLSKDALGRLLAPLGEESGSSRVVASFARQTPRPEAHAWVRRDYATAFPTSGPAPVWLPLSLPFAAVRKETWQQRPFYIESWASEDTEWGRWALSQGYEICYVPDAVAMHSHNYTLPQIYGRRFVEGEADAFIQGRAPSVMTAGRRWAGSSLGDIRVAAKARDWGGVALAPVRRAVYHWAHYRGQRHGWRRAVRGDASLTTGLDIILKHHDAAQPRSAPARDHRSGGEA